MKADVILRSIGRELRGGRGRLAYTTACLALGVAAVTGVSSLIGAIDAGVRAQSRRMLGADLQVESRRPLPPELATFFEQIPGHERSDTVELATMVSVPGAVGTGSSQLVELRAVAGRFPLHGELEVEGAEKAFAALAADEVFAAPELLRRVGVDVGGELRIGAASYIVAGRILREPDRFDFALALGPRVLMTREGLDRSELLGFGSRVVHRALFRLPRDPPREVVDGLVLKLTESVPNASFLEIESHYDAQPGLRRALSRVDSTLGLAALLSLVLGAAGVAQVIRAWVAERTRALAILRCLGARPREVSWIALGHVAVLATVGSALGAALGALAPFLVSAAAPDLVPPALVDWQFAPVARGFALGLAVALVFALPPILAAGRVSPASVFRAGAAPLPSSPLLRVLAAGSVLGGTFFAAWAQSGQWLQAAGFTVGLAAVILALAGAALGVSWLARRWRPSGPSTSVAGGLAGLGRPGAGAISSVTGLGVGLASVTMLLVVEWRLDLELNSILPNQAPSAFLVDVQPTQWPMVAAKIVAAGAEPIEARPVVMVRIAAVDGRTVEEMLEERRGDERSDWVLTREQRLTWRVELPRSNTLVEGRWFTPDDRREVSLEAEYAKDLGAGIGSIVRFDVQGIPFDFEVTSIRDIAWESFDLNFFWIVEPKWLNGVPHAIFATARIPAEVEDSLQDEIAAYAPNVTMLRIRPLLERVRSVLDRLAFGVRMLAWFAAAAGTAIVAGAVAATALRRRREVALLRALGATRGQAALRMATEHAIAGVAAGVVGGIGGMLAAIAFLSRVVELSMDLPWGLLPAVVLVGAALAVVSGLAASRFALAASPIEVLRGR